MAKGFFPMISRMRFINRWGLMRNSNSENIQEHSHMVAVLAHGLALIENTHFGGNYDPGHVAVMALYHDASEILTGDLPTPIKYANPDIRRAYQGIEEMAENQLLSMLPQDLQEAFSPIFSSQDSEIHKIVKAADKLAAHIKCVEEVKAGNQEFCQAKEQTLQALLTYDLCSLQYFIERLLPDFQLTLDELQSDY